MYQNEGTAHFVVVLEWQNKCKTDMPGKVVVAFSSREDYGGMCDQCFTNVLF